MLEQWVSPCATDLLSLTESTRQSAAHNEEHTAT